MKIHISVDPVNPTGRAGIAIVLNKEITNAAGARITEIIPGRAIHIQTNWHRAEQISVLSVYAPNLTGGDENAKFWREIHDYLVAHPRLKVDMMTGDFNMVEDMIDRLPARSDSPETIEELASLKSLLGLVDGWRTTFPTAKEFSFLQDATKSQSRIDRIYVSPSVLQTAREWKMEPSGIPGADHKLVSVQVAHLNAPWIGKGRWSIPHHVLNDKMYKAKAKEIGIKALREVEELMDERSESKNPQTIFKAFKSELLDFARLRDKTIVPRIERQLRDLQTALHRVNNDPLLETDELQIASAEIETKMRALEQKRHLDKRKQSMIRNRLEGETICKYWTTSNKVAKPRDMIFALKTNRREDADGRPTYESHSQKMAEMGRNYHDDLQNAGPQHTEERREEAIASTIENIDKAATRDQSAKLASDVTKDEVAEALRCAKNNTAAGIDGATNEMWKDLHRRHVDEHARGVDCTFDVTKLLTLVFNDIKTFGLVPLSDFAEGWMCPLYKKNDKTEIENYRPITCLNTDYKLFTKCLATRLAEAAPSLIHPSQAGFIPGRQISDQTKLVRLMLQYAEDTDQNGMIIALDQEKAYDKIKHDYLWRTLEKFNIPEEFIRPVRSLYETAETRIMINGNLSSPWKITRGVRQGDPLSCLLFDLAIEPLAASIRASTLEGFVIPGSEERLITNLFADDTTVFMSQNDNLQDLNEILDTWCVASGAKFNAGKTEIIPIGSKTYRENLLHSRKSNVNAAEIPANVHIAQEGEAVRILGAWFGNGIDAEGPWSLIKDKIAASLANWEKSNPSIEGRRLIVTMVVGGMTQYLTQVQGMPKRVEDEIAKIIRTFTWNDKRSPVSEETLFRSTEEGGRSLLDIKSRNEAIEVMWLKRYLDLSNNRPLWALVADALFAIHTPRTETNVDIRVRQNTYLQSWKTSCTERAGVCPDLRRMSKVAKKYGLRTEGIAFPKEIVRQRPIWYHSDADRKIRRMNHGVISECLKSKHIIRTVGDTETLANLLDIPEHQDHNECPCPGCADIKTRTRCEHPNECAEKANNLLNTLPPKWDPRRAPDTPPVVQEENMVPLPQAEEEEWLTFKNNFANDGSLADIFRIFTSGTTEGALPVTLSQTDEGPILKVATDGSCFNNGSDDAYAGAGVFYDPEDERNIKIKVPKKFTQSNQTAELLALKEAAEKAPANGRLHLELDSKYAIQNVTKNLKKNEDEGYINTSNEELTRLTVARLRARTTISRLKWVKGHSGHERNEGADRLADEASNLPEDIVPDCTIDPTLMVSGLRLSCITQSLAYKAVRAIKVKKNPNSRTRTKENIEKIKDAIEDAYDRRPTSQSIWKSFRRKDLSRQQRYFLWMATHDAYMIGSHWQRDNFNDEQQERAMCTHDGTLESMDHILTKCECIGQAEIWREAESLWEVKRRDTWRQPTIGLILGAMLAEHKDGNGKLITGCTRLFRIIMIESAYLIWKLRCERTIQNENNPHSKAEVIARWRKSINDRLDLDRRMTDKKLKSKALDKSLVQETWKGVLQNEQRLPENWVDKPGVLVGIRLIVHREGVG
ncbi:hypothetical protein D9615_009490 [Tricholomella constricta]|uniref:Reverse transcriptase n=1 Tax=Tricholomella constricta TaxID=117010 RepID=A0A8H5GYQ7_9AGAR|nr:hypothetical protein D9615_009490 [Tricholomella constricta]